MKVSFADVGGARIRYYHEGDGEPLLLIHGFGASADCWARTIDAFGERYRVFDDERVIARLPGPPYQFLDRIVAVAGEPWVLTEGGSCEAQYDVPRDAWYFDAARAERMPFAVLLEVALQPCGWLAAYMG